ncbi:MAG: hypothetical protein ACK4UZ_08735 [Rhizobium rhizophilum]
MPLTKVEGDGEGPRDAGKPTNHRLNQNVKYAAECRPDETCRG